MNIEGEQKSLSASGTVPDSRYRSVLLQPWRFSKRNPRQLVGRVYHHANPRIPDGAVVRTSALIWIREDIGLAQTMNTLYILRGRVDS